MKPTIINPATTHTIEDRRALTKDALKLSRHELQKEFKRRIAQLEAAKKEARIAMNPSVVQYNIAVAKAAAEALPAVADDIRYSATAINRLHFEDEEYDDEASGELEILVHVDSCSMFASLSTSAKDTAAHEKELETILAGFIPKKSVICRSGESILNWLASDHDSDDYAYDLTVHLDIAIKCGDDNGLYLSRSLDATCTSELEDARRQLVTEYRRILEINSAIDKAKEDLDNLPKMIEELDMSATAMRVKEAGGEAFLGRIMDGVQLILGGQTNLSGLALIAEDKDVGSTGSTGEERGSSSD